MELEQYLEMMAQAVRRIETAPIMELVDAIEKAYHDGQTVFLIGNGGSGANASHLCEDLGKGTLSDFEDQPRLRVISLTDNTPYILAWANDEGFERVFVEQLKNFAASGDVVLAFSGSGNSENVLRGIRYAKELGCITIGVVGYDGGRLKPMVDYCFHARVDDMQLTEDAHMVFVHVLLKLLHAGEGSC